jgi:hypothetical protein
LILRGSTSRRGVHTAEAVIKKDERRNISKGLRFAIIEAQVAWAKGKGERRGRKEGTKKEEESAKARAD